MPENMPRVANGSEGRIGRTEYIDGTSRFNEEARSNMSSSDLRVEFERDIDAVVGTQYGDEGKGMVAKLLADGGFYDGEPYRWTARVGAQNAEHRFIHQGAEFCGRVLPSAAAFRDIDVYLGAGHCFRPDHLLTEMVHMGVAPERIMVDGQAMWLKPEHAAANEVIGQARGTTGWGIGAAVAEKVRRRPGTQLIRDAADLLPGIRIGSVSDTLMGVDGPGLVEGSQGALLSLDQGDYPYCTAKNVTVPAMFGELGVSFKRLRYVFGVVRLVPMRVPGESGPAGGKELSYDEIEQSTGLRIPKSKRMQGDATKETEERVFEFSMDELLTSHGLNGYDGLAVTFADYHRPGNYRVTEWDKLHEDTRKLIMQINDTIAPVFLVRTGQGEHDNIWLKDGRPV